MLHFGKIPKKLVKFGEHSAKFWQNLRNFGKKQEAIQQFVTKLLRLESDSKAVQTSALCRSRRELSNEYLLAKFGFDTAGTFSF